MRSIALRTKHYTRVTETYQTQWIRATDRIEAFELEGFDEKFKMNVKRGILKQFGILRHLLVPTPVWTYHRVSVFCNIVDCAQLPSSKVEQLRTTSKFLTVRRHGISRFISAAICKFASIDTSIKISKMGTPAKFVPRKGEEEYYSIQPPSSTSLWYTFVEPLLGLFGHTPVDPTYGRSDLPHSPREIEIRSDPNITVRDSRVYLTSERGREEAKKTEPIKHHSQAWISYQTWHNEKAAEKEDLHADFLFVQ